MKNIQSSTPGFVLTSISFSKKSENATSSVFQNQLKEKQQSCITKFDYCLPPDEYINGEAGKQTHAA